MDRTTFPGISADAFIADADRKALNALKKLPLLPTVVRKFHESGMDRWMYCWNMASSVRCGPDQYSTLHTMLQECCDILDMPEPELYLTGNPFPNAFAGGVERPYITLRSSIVDTLDDDGLRHLIGHELGHIKAGHLLYKSVAWLIMPILDLLGKRTMGLSDAAQIALTSALFEWSRQAELTADRAGLLCSQDFDVSARANLMLTGGPNRLAHEASTDAFMDQARSYQDMDFLDSIGKLLIFFFHGATASHPMPVHRVQELEKWFNGGPYERILNGHYAKDEAAAG